MKEIKDDADRWRNIPCSWIGRINIMKTSVLPKAIYIFNTLPSKLSTVFSHRTGTDNHTFCRETQKKLKEPKRSWERRMELEESIFLTSDYAIKLQASRQYKTVQDWHKDRNIHQWNKTESPEINSCTYGHLVFDKGGRNIQWRKENLFNKWCWENWSTTCKRMKPEHFLTPYTKINWKWIKDLNVRPETIKRLKENIGKRLSNINQSKSLCDLPPRVMEIKTKISK